MYKTVCYLCKEGKNLPLWIKGQYQIFRCLKCNFVYTAPTPDKKQLAHLYNNFDYNNPKISEKVIRTDAIRSLNIINKFVKIKGNLLDVGCGRGFFLDEARKALWDVCGVDMSKEVVAYAKNVLSLKVFQGDIIEFFPTDRYDLITLNQIIEHTPDPSRLIRTCHKLFKKGGLIYIATPNIESLLAKVFKDDYEYFIPPEHLGYFSVSTLSKLLTKNGFEVIYTGSWSYRQNFVGILKRLVQSNILVPPSSVSSRKPQVQNEKLGVVKKLKYFLFDELFCRFFYRVLDIHSFGTNLEVIGRKT